MEYMPLGNLACQDYITEEETLGILYQGLQALEYLHSLSPPLAHRDIKPENILVRCRTPFVIKLVDFGLARHDSTFETFCGSNQYAAPEIWEHRPYTVMVDIWSLGVVVLEYGYRLPKPSQKRKGKPWCRDIIKSAENGEGEGDALIDLISTKMLKMDYRNRQPASACLGEVYRLGFHKIQAVNVEPATPTRKTTSQGDVTRATSLIRQPRSHAPLDSSISSRSSHRGSASQTTEVAPSKRDLREGMHFHDHGFPPAPLDHHSQEFTQNRNCQSEGKATSTPGKRRRPTKTAQAPSADAVGRGQSKRAQASFSYEAGAQDLNASSPRQRPEPLERNELSNAEGILATDVARLTQDIQSSEGDPSVNMNFTHIYSPPLKESNNEMSLREPGDDTGTKRHLPVEGNPSGSKISYYSYGDFEPRNSGLEEVKLDLRTPSKTSSRYGSVVDISRSFLIAASDE